MKTLIAALLSSAIATLCLVGCDGGFTTQEATAACAIEQKNTPTVTDDSVKSCVACYEKCGTDCKALGRTPEEYGCPEP